jgi:hypothetical protein
VTPHYENENGNLDTKPEIKNHYRGHKLSMWLSLIPQIHSPGDSPDLSMRHHHFIEENLQFYDGKRIFAIALTLTKLNWLNVGNVSDWLLSSLPSLLFISFAGKVRLQTLARPNVIKINAPSTTATPKQKTEKTPSPLMPSMTTGEDNL